MKSASFRDQQTATEISLSEYSVGSVASRAAARALLQKKRQIRDDRDAMLIFRHSEDCEYELRKMVENTHIYARGKELYNTSRADPQDVIDFGSFWSAASSAFRLAYGREPRCGEVLRFDDVETVYRVYLVLIEQFIDAWRRHLRSWPCPYRIDRAQVLIRRGAEWVKKEGGLPSPDESWARIQAEVYGDLPERNNVHKRQRKHRAKIIVFAGVKKDKACWNPASTLGTHCHRPETDSGILGILDGVLRRIGLK